VRDAAFGTVELSPPPDLVQRLEVLPQSYLKDRRVTERLILATTRQRGQDRLASALADQSGSSWPDAHYLGPLHPVLDWAADRALAKLGRGEVFAVRGTVDQPTVLLLGTLTNKAGRVVATSWMTAAFPDPANPEFALVWVAESAREAVTELGLVERRPNPGAVEGVEALTALIPVAVRRGTEQLKDHMENHARDAKERVERWAKRIDKWDDEAGTLIQRREVADRRRSVERQRELVLMMTPDRRLLRPVLVVVPENWVGAA
jgi:hypothetical protein